jgi:glucose-1-phosphate cytidylyltransferase
MKVVIFCGGLGVRMGEQTQSIPKPMIRIGNRPILWHIMRYYAAFGHREFILCLGYKGESIKEYFLSHNEALTNDFVLEGTGPHARVELLRRQADDWRVTFVETGLNTRIAGRLKAVEAHLGDDELFLATYGDGLTDVSLPRMVEAFRESGRTAMFLSVRPPYAGHLVQAEPDGTVTQVVEMSASNARMNGGFFVFKREILDWIEPGDELVEETFSRLIARREVLAYDYDGFFGPMDTIKDRQQLEALFESGAAPWIRAGEPDGRAPAPAP